MRYIWMTLAFVALAGLFFLNWQSGQAAQSGYLYQTASPAEEAGYCIAVVERIREITRGQGDRRLEQFIDEQLQFWRKRGLGAITAGRMALARDSQAPGVNEGAHLHLAIQDCGLRAVRFYGGHFPSMDQGP